MEILFLGTGAAWALPEHSCTCAICSRMLARGEERTRTSFLVRGSENILVDCGPDWRIQMKTHQLERPDAILITHEHSDHFLGLDDLLAFRRSMPADSWSPIPLYATEQTWKAIEVRFGHLLGSLIERRHAHPGVQLDGLKTRVTPFKTYHGAAAAGSVGYVLEDHLSGHDFKIVYTSDFSRLQDEPPILMEPDVLIIQSHWLNEPRENRPNHMSFQRAMDYIRKWRPRRETYLVHLSDSDQVPGDPCNTFLKKSQPLAPLEEPGSGLRYPIPACQTEWQEVIDKICMDHHVPGTVVAAYDGMRRNYE
ncbi:MAG: MBL fold metallo-hydrolase [Desulfomonilaceae bacterium]